MSRLILSFFLVVVCASTTCARWQGPETVVSGGWGGENSEFGFNRGAADVSDGFPETFTVFTDGRILIYDKWNSFIKLFDSNGKFIKKIKTPCIGFVAIDSDRIFAKTLYSKSSPHSVGVYDVNKENWVWLDDNAEIDEMPLERIYIDHTKKIIYTSDKLGNGVKYSFSNGAIEYYPEVPDVFGIRTGYKKLNDDRYAIQVKFGKNSYSWTGQNPFDSYILGSNGTYYGYGYIGGNGSEYLHLRLQKISNCGEVISSLDMPSNKDFEYYQPPIIAENGDVYIWSRSPDTYSILKWTWVDESGDPKSECKK